MGRQAVQDSARCGAAYRIQSSQSSLSQTGIQTLVQRSPPGQAQSRRGMELERQPCETTIPCPTCQPEDLIQGLDLSSSQGNPQRFPVEAIPAVEGQSQVREPVLSPFPVTDSGQRQNQLSAYRRIGVLFEPGCSGQGRLA